jgi:predicted MPP superfamily phosphohydrolase
MNEACNPFLPFLREDSYNRRYGRRLEMRKKLTIIGVLATLIIASYVIWLDASLWSLNRYRIKSPVVQSTQLPATFQNVRIVFISDLHAYANANAGNLDKILAQVNRLAPDILIFGGDLIDEKANALSEDQVNELSNFLKLMDAPLGKFSVLGLQDLAQINVVRQIYNLSDFELLENNVIDVYNATGKAIRLAGILPDLEGKTDLKWLGPDTGSFTILVSALPDILSRLSDQDADLILSGSTHGGQVNLPLFGPIYKVGNMKYISGKYKVGERILFVSNGLSTSKFNYRLFADPDLLSIRLIP